MKRNNVHSGHRLRFKERFRQTGLASFADHEVVELLLFFGIPYKDTNELAHLLLNKFGSVSGILNASYTELKSVIGIGDNTATMITFIRELFRRYSADSLVGRKKYENADAVAEYALTHYMGRTTEHVELFMFDAGGHMLAHVTVCKGALNMGTVNAETIAKHIFSCDASTFLLCHNHPFGPLVPSEEDLAVTRDIYISMKALNRDMMGHLLICGNEYLDLLDRAIGLYDN